MNDQAPSTRRAVLPKRTERKKPEPASLDRTWASALVRSAPFRTLKRTAFVAVFVSVAVALVLACAATIPSLFGYHTYTIDGGSMEPTLMVGDAAVTRPSSPRGLEVGDVIVRRDIQGGQPVLHRIVEITEQDGQLAFVTQGDQNATPDLAPVVLSGEGDKVVYRVPYAGYILNIAGTWGGRMLLIGLPLVLLAWPYAADAFKSSAAQRQSPDRRDWNRPVPPFEPVVPMVDISQPPEQLSSRALRRFVQRHSGGIAGLHQCSQHPPISGMNTLQMLAALKQETNLVATCQRVAEVCAELGTPFDSTTALNQRGRLAA